MSRKKLGGKQTASAISPGDNNSRRGRLSALFGRGPDDSEDTSRYSAALGKKVEPIKNGFTNSTEQEFQNKKFANTYMDDHINEVARDLNSAVVDVTQKVIPSFLIPSRAAKSPIHRHKRASSSFKIVDKNTADAVLLPAMPYTPSSDENRDCTYNENHAGAKGNAHAGLFSQPPMVNQKASEEVQLLASTTYNKNTHLLPSTNYISPEAMCSIPEASRNSALLTEKSSPLSSTPRIESELIFKTPQTDIVPAEGNHSPSSTSLVASTPLHGVPKVTTSDTIPSDKKVRFVIAPFSKAARAESSGDSNDANQTFEPDVDDAKVAPESILSPVIWNKRSEPKIWLKDGKPTLFKPKREPDYYTNPLWSHQYPEIFSNEGRVDSQAAAYAESTTSTDGSQYHKTSASSSNVNFHMGNTFPTNTESNTDMSFDASTSTRLATSTVTPGGSNTLPTPASHTFVGQEFPEGTNTSPDFALTPRYRSQVKIEVGGRRFVTTFEVLEKSPWFKSLFSIDFRNWYRDGVFHIDNDGDLFVHILRYLRTDLYPLFWDSRNGFDYPMYAMIKQQAHHYMLHDLEVWIVAQKFHDVVETQVIHQKVLIPHNQEWIHEQRLMGNHSYVISGVADHANPSSHLANGIDALSAGIGSAVVLFTTERIVKVDMDQLRRV
ncbi:uncharacterized protein LY79DRAFT_534560 [Colletotrichum navitas]|uniref:Potassium channel tetramerisation-type BTB domain-containing protein n=1 Tax=Colletotrichum navitas TaxID=681940 RepID=A0AAD8VD40_9PEZI|nr:uncharacterized protein LY79DRAFT_534560 [Colletotrichum navitas]KAK1600741.1 hypothetical protein LY79DRAFT_534560 [Colletotrichum navitas]